MSDTQTGQLRGLCPRIVSPRCEPGEGVCIPCRAADSLERLSRIERRAKAVRDSYSPYNLVSRILSGILRDDEATNKQEDTAI